MRAGHGKGNRPMETVLILSLAIEIADALDPPMQRALFHRDIKPAPRFSAWTLPARRRKSLLSPDALC